MTDLKNEPIEDEIRQRVEARFAAREEFYQHLAVFLTINSVLWGIFFFTGAGYPWPLWVFFPWGFGLLAHYFDYYTKHGAGRVRREQRIQEMIDRERRLLYGDDAHKLKNEALFYDDDTPFTEEHQR